MPYNKQDFTPEFCRGLLQKYGTKKDAGKAIAPECRSERYSGRPVSAATVTAWILTALRTEESETPPQPDETSVVFPDLKNANVDWEAALSRHGAIAEARRAEDPKQKHATIDLSKHDGPVCIMQMSDVHIGSPQCDVAALIRHIKLLKSIPNLYVIIDGDVTEWAISPRMLDATLGQVGPPQEQVRVFQAILNDLASKCIAFVTGNHDERGFRMAGVDVFEFLLSRAEERGAYLRDGGVLTITMAGGVKYSWRVSHGDGLRGHSMYSNTAAMSRNARHEYGWCDVSSAGHTHDPEIKQVYEPRAHGALKEPTILLRSGTYKVVGDEQYPDRMGFNETAGVAMPAVIFFPHEKRMLPFFRVEDAVDVLRALSDKAA